MENLISYRLYDTAEFVTLSVKQLESIENDLNLHTELSQRNDDRIQDTEDKISKSTDSSNSIDGAVAGDIMDIMDHVKNIEAENDKKFNALHADIHSVAKNMEYIEGDLKERNQMSEESSPLNKITGLKYI